eukprot:gnl/MRDRNA2_/MRDRNA2_35634_c0_seq2.p1 gnl/MRDRNA2_/MRDRNA2_35634_c0~~gnl/MRDRNA2_/MRDRNA2_35634_c0_seq2.p1  ORF type:complete len:222 (+),score=60.31 gnl/MRDRNA2_/MRDRNA2_35634_c0_seq2:81-746(+)
MTVEDQKLAMEATPATQAVSPGDASLAAWHGAEGPKASQSDTGSNPPVAEFSNVNIAPPTSGGVVKDGPKQEPCTEPDNRIVASTTQATSPGDESLSSWYGTQEAPKKAAPFPSDTSGNATASDAVREKGTTMPSTQAVSPGDDSLTAWHGGGTPAKSGQPTCAPSENVPISNILPPSDSKPVATSTEQPCAPVDDRNVASTTVVTSPGDDSLVNWHANPQ